jgi:hypothetical protein
MHGINPFSDYPRRAGVRCRGLLKAQPTAAPTTVPKGTVVKSRPWSSRIQSVRASRIGFSQEYRKKVSPQPTIAPATAATKLLDDTPGGAESFNSAPFRTHNDRVRNTPIGPKDTLFRFHSEFR